VVERSRFNRGPTKTLEFRVRNLCAPAFLSEQPLRLEFGSVGRRSFARRFYDRQGILCPVDLVALTEQWIRGNPDSPKTLNLRLVAEMIRGLTCHAVARHMPSRLGCAKGLDKSRAEDG
jgi:hypothetical protein